MDRLKKVAITGVIGIVVNMILGLIKIVVGTASNSIAIISDAVNNFTDSVSSVVTIITLLFVKKGATEKHPFGFGRVEYFSGLIISVLVLVTGIEFLISSVEKIISPEETVYTTTALVMLVVAIVGKIFLGLYTRGVGKKENAPSLIASGQDALSDAIITAVTLAGAIITLVFDVNLDGYLGVVVSLFVLKSGLEIVSDVIGKLMGERPDTELADQIMEDIMSKEGIIGAYDLILHNYGPNVYIGNVNVELDEGMTIKEAYQITKPLNMEVFEKHGVFLFIGFYAVNTTDGEFAKKREFVRDNIESIDDVLQIHAFYVDEVKKYISFDVVVSFKCKEQNALIKKIIKIIKSEYPEYEVVPNIDKDYSLSKVEK